MRAGHASARSSSQSISRAGETQENHSPLRWTRRSHRSCPTGWADLPTPKLPLAPIKRASRSWQSSSTPGQRSLTRTATPNRLALFPWQNRSPESPRHPSAERLRSRLGKRDERLHALVGVARRFRYLQSHHGSEGGAPVDKPSSVRSDCRSQPLRACGNGLGILGPPEHQVDRVESRVTKAGRWIDRYQATVLTTVEDVHRRQVPVKEHARTRVLGKPHRQPTSPLVELW